MQLEQVYEKAEEIRLKYNPEGLSPFPYENIESAFSDLKVYFLELPERVSGAISFDKEDSTYKIIINSSKPKTRQHFTVAHELGHYFLHGKVIQSEEIVIDGDGTLEGNKVLFRLDDAESNRIETEANNFAASLIMPKDLVVKAWKSLGDVEECAKIFNVSISAMSIRLERLGLVD
jgi:Zn-dependent peptidase ImmA (M78 family)